MHEERMQGISAATRVLEFILEHTVRLSSGEIIAAPCIKNELMYDTEYLAQRAHDFEVAVQFLTQSGSEVPDTFGTSQAVFDELHQAVTAQQRSDTYQSV